MKNLWLSAGFAPALLLLGSASTFASTENTHDTHRQHDAHEHGHATFNLVQQGQSIQMMLESPAVNIVGFEHIATDPEEKQKIANAVGLLKQGEKLFSFNAAAQCTQTEVEVESELAEFTTHDEEHSDHEESSTHEKHSADKDHSAHSKPEGHTEFEVSYQFTCERPAALDTLTVHIFEFFPLTEEIEAQLVTDKRQFAAELSSKDATVHF